MLLALLMAVPLPAQSTTSPQVTTPLPITLPSCQENITIPEGIEEIGESQYDGCHALKTVKFPSTLKIINKYAFYNLPLTEVDLSNTSVTEIRLGAFSYSGIETVKFPSTLIKIGEDAFYSALQLTEVDLSSTNLEYIHYGAFKSCTGLKYISFPKTLTYVENDILKIDFVSYYSNVEEVIVYDYNNLLGTNSRTNLVNTLCSLNTKPCINGYGESNLFTYLTNHTKCQLEACNITAFPTTASPTTASPTTASPTTASPTTASPTTASPTTSPTNENDIITASPTIAPGTSGGCPDNTVHWLQPNLQGVEPSLLEGAKDAWCYPTAAASLLGKLANDGKWNSKMKESDKYPTDSQYTFNQNDPWGDYSWHEKNSLNLGFYMKTNNPQPGTTLENGKKGIEDFMNYIDPSKNVKVAINSGIPNITQKAPFLLHIATKCIPDTIYLNALPVLSLLHDNNAEEDIERINNSPAALGHTVVAYDSYYEEGDPNKQRFKVAMNLFANSNYDGKQCDSTILQVSPDQTDCITHYTTVEIQNKEMKSDDEEALSLGAIIGIAVGGTVVVGVAGYAIYRWRTKSGRSESPMASAGSLIF